MQKGFSYLLLISFAVILSFHLVAAESSVNLGTARNFSVLGGSAITNTGATTRLIGNVGLDPTGGASITGLTCTQVTGSIYDNDAGFVDGGGQPCLLTDAAFIASVKGNLTEAYNNAVAQNANATVATELGGTTKTAGVYNSSDGTFGITGTLTLDAQGNPNAVFIFKMATTLTTAASSQVVLTNGAKARNVFWQVGSSATLGTNSIFNGNVLALTSITLTTGSVVQEGRLLARNGAVTLDTNNVTLPADDTTGPSVVILFPQNKGNYSTTSLGLNFTVNDSGSLVDSCWYTKNGGATNTTLVACNNATNVVASEGNNTWTVYANDSFGNLGSASVNFTVDTIPPIISIAFPVNGTNYTTALLAINFSASDAGVGLSSCWWTNNSGTTNNTIGCGANITGITWDQGFNVVRIYVNDSLDNGNLTAVTFFVDSIIPSLIFVSPTEANNSNLSRNNLALNLTAGDANYANMTVYLVNSTGTVNITVSTATNVFINFTNLPDDTYYINATALDTLGNRNTTETRKILIDATNPSIQFVSPTLASGNYSRSAIEANVTATDANRDSITLNLYNSTGLVNGTTRAAGNIYVNFTGLPDGAYTLNATVNDTVNNRNSTETRTFYLDSLVPSIIFVSPTEANNSNLARNNLALNLTAGDLNYANVTIYLVNSTGIVNTTISAAANVFINYTGLPDDIYYINATARDTLGNSNTTETRKITIDATNPLIQFVSPSLAAGNYSRSAIEANVTASDANRDSITLNLYNSTGLVNSTVRAVGNLYINFTGLPDGTYGVNATVNDTLGHTNATETRTFVLDTSKPLINNVAVSDISSSAATINWDTSEAANYSIKYGTNSSLLGDNSSSASLTTANNVTLSGLSSSTTYYFNLTSCDAIGNCNYTSTMNFTTTSAPVSGGGGRRTFAPFPSDEEETVVTPPVEETTRVVTPPVEEKQETQTESTSGQDNAGSTGQTITQDLKKASTISKIGENISAFTQNIGRFFSNGFNSVKNFLQNLFSFNKR